MPPARPDAATASGAGAAPDGVALEPEVPTSKVAAVQQNLDQVKTTMATNIELLIDRGERLEDLDNRADALGEASKGFKTSAGAVQRKMRWQKWKWRLCCLLVVLILCSGLITTLVLVLKN